MEEGSEFYVVRKGNTVAVYRNLSDCQSQAGSSVSCPAVSAYKGRSWSKETEEYLTSHGLKNPLFTIDASELKADLFGSLLPCSFQDGVASNSDPYKINKKRDVAAGSNSNAGEIRKKPRDLGNYPEPQPDIGGSGTKSAEPFCPENAYHIESVFLPHEFYPSHPVEAQEKYEAMLCVLEFDGASKGNPGKAGAGAILRTEDGRVLCRLCEGLGVATNNVAEYRAVILGLKYALNKGFKRIQVQGDSQLVCMQVEGRWQVKHPSMMELCKQVNELKQKFVSFTIKHVRREYNSDADQQANLAINLAAGQVSEEHGEGF